VDMESPRRTRNGYRLIQGGDLTVVDVAEEEGVAEEDGRGSACGEFAAVSGRRRDCYRCFP
jgi:hypothetical protein